MSRMYLHFLNEHEEKEEVWDLTMKTEEGVEDIINSIRPHWEEMFSIPLQVSSTVFEA